MIIRIAVLCLMLIPCAGFAQEFRQTGKNLAAARSAMLQSLKKGKSLMVGREEYRHVPQALAVMQGAGETPHDAMARIGEGDGELLETKGRLVLFRSSKEAPAFVGRIAGTTVYPAAVNIRTGTLGVLTGMLVVKPKNMADADAIGGSHGLEKSKIYPQLQTVFYRAKAGVDIADVSAALQADPRVESAYPEIVEHVRVPK